MQKYFYTDGLKVLGPYTLEELQKQNITRETKVWFHDLNEWKPAGSIDEIKEIFALMPPPIRKPIIKETIIKQNQYQTTDVYLFIAIAFWFIYELLEFIFYKSFDVLWEPPLVYFRIGMSMLFIFVPFAIALALTNKALRVSAIILASLLASYTLYHRIDWLISYF